MRLLAMSRQYGKACYSMGLYDGNVVEELGKTDCYKALRKFCPASCSCAIG